MTTNPAPAAQGLRSRLRSQAKSAEHAAGKGNVLLQPLVDDLREAADCIDALCAALEPFDDALGEDDEFPDETKVTVQYGRTTYYSLKLGDLRNARTARARGEQ